MDKAIYNKLIHKDEFRLRILVTNECDKNCSFCLNDFQPKKPVVYSNILDVADCLRAYGSFMKDKSIVTFSGGEPGLHPGLEFMLINAKHYCKTVKVVTNGLALKPGLVDYVDAWHVGVTKEESAVVDFLQYSKDITAQIVVTESDTHSAISSLVWYYHDNGIKVKIFPDFKSDKQNELRDLILWIMKPFKGDVSTRFTGRQINRGVACLGCKRRCVTLKALWIFPDGRSSTCPQGVGEYFDDDSWDETVEQAYNNHKWRGGQYGAPYGLENHHP